MTLPNQKKTLPPLCYIHPTTSLHCRYIESLMKFGKYSKSTELSLFCFLFLNFRNSTWPRARFLTGCILPRTSHRPITTLLSDSQQLLYYKGTKQATSESVGGVLYKKYLQLLTIIKEHTRAHTHKEISMLLLNINI